MFQGAIVIEWKINFTMLIFTMINALSFNSMQLLILEQEYQNRTMIRVLIKCFPHSGLLNPLKRFSLELIQNGTGRCFTKLPAPIQRTRQRKLVYESCMTGIPHIQQE